MRNRETGWSAVELAASITLLVFGLLSLAAGFQGTSILTQKTRENNLLGQAFRNMEAKLEEPQLATVPTQFGPGSGRENFWLGDNNADTIPEQKIFYTAPLKPLVSGNVRFYDETTLPANWLGFLGGLDLNADGLIADVLSLLGLLGPPPPPPRILPTKVTLTMNGLDGPRTINAEFILTR